MQLNNTTQYAIRILNYIAVNGNEKLYSAKELSNILNIPYKFLTKIMTELVKAEFVNSIRGRDGGFKLAKEANEIKIIDILNAFNEDISSTSCLLGIGKCDSQNKCALHDQWVEPKGMIQKMFEETTLYNLDGEDFKI